MDDAAPPAAAVVLRDVGKRFGTLDALQSVSATIAPGRLTGLVGPDGAGKTTLMRLMAGLMAPGNGRVTVAGLDTATAGDELPLRVGYMPQRFGLYEDLSVAENLALYAELRGLPPGQRDATFAQLLAFTQLGPFTARLAGQLSGGMKQKLGLACALMARPQVLLLDEPGVGVDPVSRQDLWRMVGALTRGDPLVAAEGHHLPPRGASQLGSDPALTRGMAVVWATAYLDEAERCAHVLLLHEGRLLFDGPPAALTGRLTGRSHRLVAPTADRRGVLQQALDLPAVCDGVVQGRSVRVVLRAGQPASALQPLADASGATLAAVPARFEDAFVDLLGGGPGGTSALAARFDTLPGSDGPVVECRALTRRFGTFVAADAVTLAVKPGEIFGLLGPNGAGKSTTFKMLCGLLKPSGGEARVAGVDLRGAGTAARRQLGYMAQKFSLYGLLSVAQNLDFSAGVYGLHGTLKRERIGEMIETFGLQRFLAQSPDELPLGYKQRLALACALMHRPRVLFLDEPTSGVDPITRREFWTHINGLVQRGVTIMVTTHFMDEAEYCDRVAMMYRARLIALDTPDALKAGVATSPDEAPSMEDAFIRLVQREDAAVAQAAARRAA